MAGSSSPTASLTLHISETAREKLAQRASQAGEDIETYASDLIEAAVKRPTLDELLAPVRQDFAKTGMTEEQIMQFGDELIQKVRQEKTNKA
ncbi:MAG TPA: hypothetical protein VG733_02215 [Chthoniobacteraceae bacterium]|nr:hypothetical protein [Chthoniobacteraceae bacterium]